MPFSVSQQFDYDATTTVRITITAPLPDGREFTQGPLAYNADGFATAHNCEFLQDPRFVEASTLGMETIRLHLPEVYKNMSDVRYRTYFYCWAAEHATRLPGDFVECGVAVGTTSLAAAKYVGFERFPSKTWYLMDTFEGYPMEQFTPKELERGIQNESKFLEIPDNEEIVKRFFADYPNIKTVKGAIPGSLHQVKTQQVAYLMIDMNAAKPEVEAMRYFWPKMVTGGIVCFDDYGRNKYIEQKRALDEWAKTEGISIFQTATGNGMLIKH